MAKRTDPEETPQFVTFQPWRIRIAIAVVFLVLIVVAAELVPDGPYLLTTGPVFFVGYTALSFAMHRSVAIRLEDHAVDIRQGWRKARVPYEQITEVAVGPRTEWWRIGRRRVDDGATGYLMGGPSVRITTGETSVVVSAEESYRVVGAIQRKREHAAEARSSDTEQAER
ncbi:hypothetical protein [Kocuria rosea]|uniref:PH domain-containing protein n=1 Tax=Kocuria rosea TaxID=1275 RepID=A0A4R5YCA5_KOCRO|nr:hypothetical protein [Kocuria rosea]TDL42472.1 hypothetical protein E2R59_11035 [Kocuria rosea]